MKTIRKGVFETNSSSTHSITIMSEEDYDKWVNDQLYYNETTRSLQTKEEMYEEVRNFLLTEYNLDEASDEYVEEHIYDNQGEYPITYDEFIEDRYLEVDETRYTTKSGEKLVIICKYGNDN